MYMWVYTDRYIGYLDVLDSKGQERKKVWEGERKRERERRRDDIN